MGVVIFKGVLPKNPDTRSQVIAVTRYIQRHGPCVRYSQIAAAMFDLHDIRNSDTRQVLEWLTNNQFIVQFQPWTYSLAPKGTALMETESVLINT